MSLKEQMQTGKVYMEFGHASEEDKAYEKVIERQRLECKERCFDFNQTRPLDTKKKDEILRGLLAPGCSIGMHTHKSNSEVIYVLSGTGKMLIDDGVNAKFIIAGTGSYEKALKEKVKRFKLEDKIIFTGFITDVDKLMNITDIQVNASYGTEATSLALLEGMSIGVPAVVSNFGGNPGVIKDGVNGFVVAKQNSAALKKGIERLLCDDELYDEMSLRCKEVFSETFTSVAMTRKTEDMYTDVIERKM